jgi:hypothetical protein
VTLKSPLGRGLGLPFLHHTTLPRGNNLGTDMLKQHARSSASCMVILGDIRRKSLLFRLLPYIFLQCIDEAMGSNPLVAVGDPFRSTLKPEGIGNLFNNPGLIVAYPYSPAFQVVPYRVTYTWG